LAFIPLSTIFEVVFAVLWLLLYRSSLTLERLCGVGFAILEIPLLTLPQQNFIESSGTLTLGTLAFPAPIIGYVTIGMLLLIFISLYRTWDLYSLNKEEAMKDRLGQR
jgi:hypothetical protein